MAVRLNGWQRIGVVLSVLWLVVFLIWGLNDSLNGRGSFFVDTPDQIAIAKVGCHEVPPTPAEASKGWGPGYECPPNTELPERHQFNTAGFWFVVIAPLLIAWLLVYACVFCVRWIAKGFKQKKVERGEHE
jgi:flagellar biogenesis protein FliO